MEENNKLYESINNYTKFKLVEMLLNRLNDGRTKLDDLNSIEDLADDVLKTLAICGLKYHNELKDNFEKE